MADIKDPENTLIMETTKGQVVIALRPDLAPNHCERLKELAREGFYDGIVFHRVIDGFMAQVGCPHGTGTGGSDKPNLKARVQPNQTCSRFLLHGPRHGSELCQQPVLHLLHGCTLARQSVHLLG